MVRVQSKRCFGLWLDGLMPGCGNGGRAQEHEQEQEGQDAQKDGEGTREAGFLWLRVWIGGLMPGWGSGARAQEQDGGARAGGDGGR